MSKNLPQTSAPCKRQAISTDSLETIYQDIIILLDQIIKSVAVEANYDIQR